jgi:hypothetical protein
VAHYLLLRPGHLSQRLVAENPHALLTGRGQDSRPQEASISVCESSMG